MNNAPRIQKYLDLEIIRLTRDGEWLADEEPITHERTLQAFQSHLFPTADGNGWEIRIGRETKRIEIEDTAFFVRMIEGDPQTGFTLHLTDGVRQKLDPQTLRYSPGRLVCTISWNRQGGATGQAEAKFLRAPYHELLAHAAEVGDKYVLTVEGVRYELT